MRNNQHFYQHQSPSTQYYDSPQSSQREQDIASLIEKKLGSIESYFQNVISIMIVHSNTLIT